MCCEKAKDINVKVLQHAIQIKNGIIKHVNVNVKFMITAKKIIAGHLAHVFVR